jgi:hypothetical protein
VIDFVSKFPQYQSNYTLPPSLPTSIPPPIPPSNDIDSDIDEETPSIWKSQQARFDDCGFISWFGRPESSCAFIIVHCFSGVKFTISQTSPTMLELKCNVSFRDDMLCRIGRLTHLGLMQLHHSLPAREITTYIDMERPIISFDNMSSPEEVLKVIRVTVQPDIFPHKLKWIV